MGVVKLGFDDLVSFVQQGDVAFEAPGHLLILRGSHFFYAEKPKGSAEKVFPWSRNLIHFSEGRVTLDLEYDGDHPHGDPPCLVCGRNFPSVNKLRRHEHRHLTRDGIGYAARAKRRVLAAKLR